MDKFFEEGTLSEEEMVKGLKLGVMNRGTFPVICISAKNDQGVDRMMQIIKGNCPNPAEALPVKTTNGNELHCDSTKPTVAYVFKSAVEQHLGDVAFMKVSYCLSLSYGPSKFTTDWSKPTSRFQPLGAKWRTFISAVRT